MSSSEDRPWNPYVAGVLTGLLVVLSALYTSNYFGASSTFVRAAGLIERFLGPEHVAQTRYFARYLPHVDWQWFFLAGVSLGALAAALLSRDFAWRGCADVGRALAWGAESGRGLRGRAAPVGARIAGG
jgi:hypothetical protein